MIGTKILEERKSKFNGDIKVVKTFGMGTYIQVGGLTQSGGIVESIWKSTIRKVRKREIKNCLILGLGGGTVAKIIQKTWPEAKIVGVDMDPTIVELGKKYLGIKNVQVKIKDAYDVEIEGYDLVIVDLYQGDMFPKKFENDKFLKKLTKNKLIIFNRLYYKDKKLMANNFGLKLKGIFKKVEYYYPEANLMFLCYNS